METPPGQYEHLPWGQSCGEVITATAATPLTVRDGFLIRNGSKRSLSAGSTLARTSELGGTPSNPYLLQSFSLRFCRESRSFTAPVLTAAMRSADRRSI